VTGKAEIMKEGEKNVFISSTFFPNSLSYVAALKTIEVMERDDILGQIWKKGEWFIARVRELCEKYNTGAQISGIPPMMFITFKKDPDKIYKQKRTEFYTQLIRRGIFLQPYHHGYICARHSQQDLEKTVQAIEEAMQYLVDKYGNA
jgi:glutamate-1-semialdehyde aminotransferase